MLPWLFCKEEVKKQHCGQSSCDKEKPESPQLELFRFLHTPEKPVCCQSLLVLQSACASATTHSCSPHVLKSLSAGHRGQNMSWHHCWKLSLQVSGILSRQQGQTWHKCHLRACAGTAKPPP